METAAGFRPPDDLLPPPDPATVYRAGLAGLGLVGAAALLGLAALALGDGAPPAFGSARLLLAGGGCLLAGAAVTLRPGLPGGWAVAAAAFGLAAVGGLPGGWEWVRAVAVNRLGLGASAAGYPEAWDSARLLARVMAVGFAAGAGLAALPRTPRLVALSAAVVFHFGGLLCAVTWPDPTPWLTNQVGQRVYSPYLTFLYLRNAYHFYSPEPGPASHLVCLLRYELDATDPATGKPKVEAEWATLPRRDEHMKDPLGLSYYRRLSLTEMVSGSIPGLVTAENFEKLDARKRRVGATVQAGGAGREAIPIVPLDGEAEMLQYRVPQQHVSRYLFPSYARHLADEYATPGRRVTSVRLYRVEHRITPVHQFSAGADPYHPRTYRPYYVGEYDPRGNLLDPQDEMLYWLVPIVPKPGGVSPADPDKRDYIDYLSKHAGYEFDWRRMRP